MLVDSHCHLDFPDFAADFDGILARADAAGVGAMVTVSTHLSTFDGVRTIAETHDHVYCSVGIHPHHVSEEPAATALQLAALADHPKVVGIGETGLDFYYDNSPRDEQAAAFRQHIAAARKTGLPVIVHTRSADEETVNILAEEMGKGAFTGVIHCFSTGRALAEAAVEMGLYISFSGILTFKNAEDIRKTAQDLPLDRLLVETDAPYLAPVPKRGKRNEPAYVAYTARRLAEVKGVTEKEMADRTTENFFRLFTKAAPPETA